MADAALRFENLTLGYDRHPAVHHLDYSVAKGDLLAVTGPNGAGKTTLFKGIIGALPPLGGRIRLEGVRREDIAYLPQQAAVDPKFPVSVHDMVAAGLWRDIGAFGRVGRDGAGRVAEALRTVGLAGFERRSLPTLSGGQFQKTLFARLLVQDASLILLDEPFAALDSRTVRDLMELVKRWHGEARTVIAVLHDLEQVRAHFPLTLLLARTPVAAGPTRDVLSPANLNRARALTEAFQHDAAPCPRP